MKYNIDVDKKWLARWEHDGIYKYNPGAHGEKFYALEMFSYPSGLNLHLGHWFNFAPADTFSRFKKMQGYNLFHPMGFDAFGLPAENFAIKTGIHPKDSTYRNMDTMRKQLKAMGTNYCWDYTLETCSEEYYKFTQWLFVKLYKHGLAYKKKFPVNWCSKCNTVLANEQVLSDGKCERCGTMTEKKRLSQWAFKTTAYAERLIKDIETVNWPDSTKKIQLNWIGRSEGANIKFKVESVGATPCRPQDELSFEVFTTRCDTLYGCTYVVIAPENELVAKLTDKKHEAEVKAYVEKTARMSEIDRMSTVGEKTGVFTGAYALNPINGKKVPIWIADYVVDGYGSGCVMAVPAHDSRDFDFAKKYKLPVIGVIASPAGKKDLPYCDDGILYDSKEMNGLTSEEARKAIVKKLSETNEGSGTVNYRLKDWTVSRQRYWGAPIPIVYCPKCGEVVVEEKDLPVKLPYDVAFKPTGESPLKSCKEFMNCKCPKCGGPAERESDTLDTFVCSSWYFLRHTDPTNPNEPFDKKKVNRLAPVDIYIGGQEHASMHLLYARFVTKFLHDIGYVDFTEPFTKLVHQGMILGSDGQKMSKSNNNGVSPDEYVNKYGADVLRLYLMDAFAYTQGGAWSDEGVHAVVKFMTRVTNTMQTVLDFTGGRGDNKHASEGRGDTLSPVKQAGEAETELLIVKNDCMKQIEMNLESLNFHSAIASLNVLLNAMNLYLAGKGVHMATLTDVAKDYIRLLAPLSPYFSEELWEAFGGKTSVHLEKWPVYKEYARAQTEVAVQINGRVRAVVKVPTDAEQAKAQELAMQNAEVAGAVAGKNIKKVIYVKNRILNLVVGD